MKLVIGAALLAIGMVLPTAAQAGCTLGVKTCKNGYWWYCEKCGSETCMIFKGIKCHRPEVPTEDKVTFSPVPERVLASVSSANGSR